MKKLLLFILTILCFTASTFAQSEWEEVFSNEELIIEMKTVECNPFNNTNPNTYGILRYVNLTDHDVTFKFVVDLWFNGQKADLTPKDSGDESVEKTVKIGAGKQIVGSCEMKDRMFKVFYKHNHPKMNIELTKIQITPLN